MSQLNITFLKFLQCLRYSPDKILNVEVTTKRSKVKSRLYHDVAQLHPPNQVPTKYHLHTVLIVSEIQPRQNIKGQGTYCKVKGQIKVILSRYYTPTRRMFTASIKTLHLLVSDIPPRQNFLSTN